MTIRTSNSEVLAFSTCEAKWAYAFHPAYHLEPKYQSLALVRGIIGHEALQAFFTCLRFGGVSFTDSVNAAKEVLAKAMAQAIADPLSNKTKAVTELIPILDEYFKSDYLKNFLKDCDIVSVEESFDVEIDDNIHLVGRADLVVYHTRGKYKGEVTPVDNKFVYNFWSEDDFRMNSQIPTYVYALRKLYPDKVIKRGIINQIRHRNNATERFVLTSIDVSRAEVENVVNNHLRLTYGTFPLRSFTTRDEVEAGVTRSLSKYSCHNCGFKKICRYAITGGNVDELVKMDYQSNSYGYTGDEE